MEMKQCNKCNGTGKIPGGIGAELAAKRKKLLITQSDVAAKMGITNPQLSRLEHDKEVWSRQRMDNYNAALTALRNGGSNGK